MTSPLRHLPVIQHWDCHGCTHCCQEYQINVTDEERSRIEAQGWDQDAALAGTPLFVRVGAWWSRRFALNQRPSGACVFLNEQGRCRIHERFGAEAKPLACRLYPFMLIPAGKEWRVGLRFSCPSAAANRGQPAAEHRLDFQAREFAQQTGVRPDAVAPPPLRPGQQVDWSDLVRFTETLLGLLEDRRLPFERRLRQGLALARICRQAHFEKVSGPRLAELLDLLARSVDGEVPDASALQPPSWIGRVLFRQTVAFYTRRDHGPQRGLHRSQRTLLPTAAWRFVRGRGPVPRVHAALPDITFEQIEQTPSAMTPAVDQTLERYYRVKVASMQFCGATHFGLPFWDGFEGLALTLPVILWLMRALPEPSREQAAARAIEIVDHNFGFFSALGGVRQRLAQKILVQRGELERLMGWYSR